MSKTTKNLPQCTRTTVMDNLFRREHQLSYAETMIMSYLAIAHTWAIDIDGYSLLRTSKIKNDLLLGEKTIEAAITKLKKLELIETKSAKYEKWSQTQKYRTVKITLEGQKYNLSYHKPEEYTYIASLEEKIEDYQSKNEFIKLDRDQIKQENGYLELKIIARDGMLENQDRATHEALLALENEKELKNRIENLEKSLEEARAIIKQKEESLEQTRAVIKEEQKVELVTNKDADIEVFRKKTIKIFSANAKVLCNGVDGWHHDVLFYVNSFSRLMVKLLTGKFEQITDPDRIQSFWKWLFENQDRIGKIVDKPVDQRILKLISFEGKIFSTKKHKVKKIKAVDKGVTILLENIETHNQGLIADKNGNTTIPIEKAISYLEHHINSKE